MASNAIGSAIANKRKRQAEAEYKKAMGQQIDLLDNQINANYLDSAEAQDALRKQTNANTETLRQLNTSAIRGGATDEAKVAMASKLNQSTADLVGDLAAIGEQKKEALRAEKRAMELGQIEHSYALNSDVSGMDALTNSISSAAGSLGTSMDDAGVGAKLKQKWQDWRAGRQSKPTIGGGE